MKWPKSLLRTSHVGSSSQWGPSGRADRLRSGRRLFSRPADCRHRRAETGQRGHRQCRTPGPGLARLSGCPCRCGRGLDLAACRRSRSGGDFHPQPHPCAVGACGAGGGPGGGDRQAFRADGGGCAGVDRGGADRKGWRWPPIKTGGGTASAAPCKDCCRKNDWAGCCGSNRGWIAGGRSRKAAGRSAGWPKKLAACSTTLARI